jgi:DNA-binding response OmpR family regulator
MMSGQRTPGGGTPVVLVVDDEQDVRELHARRLQHRYDVRTAGCGSEALEQLDDVDVVVLDRRMPGLSGDRLLRDIRDRGLDCRVTMLTGVDPDFDIVDMPFDEYLTKPVTTAELQGTIESLLTRSAYEDTVQEYFSLAAKRATLEVQKDETELQSSPEFDALTDRVEQVSDEAEDLLTDLDDDAIDRMFTSV